MSDTDEQIGFGDDPTEDLVIEFVDDDEDEDYPPPPPPPPRPPAAPVAESAEPAKPKAVVKASAKKVPARKQALPKIKTVKAASKKPSIKASVAKKAPGKTTAKARPVAKAVVKAIPKKAAAAVPAPKPAVQVVARPDTDAAPLMRQALKAHGEDRLDEAATLYNRILQMDPEYAPAWINLGVLLRRTGKWDSAVTCLKRGIALKPDDGPAWSNLGNALRAVNRLDEAVAAQSRALDLSPDVARVHYNYGLSVRDKGDLEEASHAIRRAGLLGYDSPELAWDQSLTHLMAGDLRTGFAEYESRWALPEINKLHTRLPEWNGEQLDGKTLLVWAEQGMGDTLQFCRYVIDSADGIAAMGGKIVLEVQAPLARLLQKAPEFSKVSVVARGTRLPPADYQIPLLSLPRIIGTELDSIPDHCPYILPPSDAEPPKGLHADRLKVGICWAGKPSHKNDRNRSAPLTGLATLFDLPHTDFVSLQKGPATADIDALALGPLLRNMGNEFKDFADTAAAIRELDLVITVDTSVAHLAGAMARPVWVLLPYAPDWRWMLHRDDSPWYPSMTLFRQTSPGDWNEVFTRIRQALIRKLRSLA